MSFLFELGELVKLKDIPSKTYKITARAEYLYGTRCLYQIAEQNKDTSFDWLPESEFLKVKD